MVALAAVLILARGMGRAREEQEAVFLPLSGAVAFQTLDYRTAARAEALAMIVKALEEAGIKFLPSDSHGPGIRGQR